MVQSYQGALYEGNTVSCSDIGDFRMTAGAPLNTDPWSVGIWINMFDLVNDQYIFQKFDVRK